MYVEIFSEILICGDVYNHCVHSATIPLSNSCDATILFPSEAL